MKIEQVAAQLYTLRETLKGPAQAADTLRKVRAIGYRAVQVSGVAVEQDELVRILRDEGLVCCATHEPGPVILGEPQRVVERLCALDCQITAYAYPAGVDLGSEAAVDGLARGLDAAGAVLHAAGLALCYHNHHVEFRRLGGRTVLERIYERTDPRHLQAELDTYWVQYGGGDPAGWCRRMNRRLPILHLKDYQVTADNQVTYAEIGRGNLDWKAIVAAAEAAGCRWFAVEQDTCPGDPLDSLRQSFDYIGEHLCSN